MRARPMIAGAASAIVVVTALAAWRMRTAPAPAAPSARPTGALTPATAAGTRGGVIVAASAAAADPTATLRLEGQVIDTDEQPVAGAMVALSTIPPRTVRSEADGTFVFTGLPARAFSVAATLDDRLGGPSFVTLTARTEPVILRMRRGATVEILAFDVQTTRPLANVSIELREPVPTQVATGPRGVARLRAVAPGRHRLLLTAAGYAPAVSWFQTSDQPGAVESHVVGLQPGAPVGGRVVDSDGRPVAGAIVTGESAARGEPLVDAQAAPTSDGDGRWHLGAVAAGTVRFTARDRGHAPGTSAPIVVDGKTARDDVTIVLSRGGRIAGRVVTKDGRPAAGASVRAASADHGEPLAEARCDGDGAFELGGLPLGAVELLAVGDAASSSVKRIDLGAHDEATGVQLALDVDAVIAGIVVNADGAPVPEAQVSATPDDNGRAAALADPPVAVSDGGGRFELRGLAEGRYRLHAAFASSSSSARAPAELVARTGERNARIVLDENGAIRGEVAFADGGAPDFFQVRLDGRVPIPVRGGTTFRVSSPAGHHVLHLQGPGFRDKVLADVEVSAGKERDVGLQRLDRGRTLRGRVVAANGSGVGGARISTATLLIGDGSSLGAASGALGVGRLDATSAADGSFVIGGLGDQPYTVVAEHPSAGRSAPTPIAATGDPEPLTLTLVSVASLDGVVTRAGKPVAGAGVAATSRAQGQTRFVVRTGADGSYRFDKLTPDEYTVTAAARDDAVDQRTTTRTAHVGGEPAHLDLELPSGEASCRVRLPSPGGHEVINAQLYLVSGSLSAQLAGELDRALSQRADGTIAVGHIIGSGSVTFDRLAAGPYTLCSVTLRGDLADPVVAERIRDGAAALPVTCQAVRLRDDATPVDVVVALPPG